MSLVGVGSGRARAPVGVLSLPSRHALCVLVLVSAVRSRSRLGIPCR
jgi:hypothetical protein